MRLRDVLLLLIVSVLFGSSYLFMRMAGPEFGAFSMALGRVLTGALCIFPFMFCKSRWKKFRQRWVSVSLVGMLICGVPYLLFCYASLAVSAGFAAILNATVPLFGAIVAVLWLGERLTVRRSLGLVIGFLGVMTLVGFNLSFKSGGTGWSILAALAATFCYGSGATAAKKYLQGVDAVVTCTGALMASTVLLLPLGVYCAPTTMPSLWAWSAIIGIGAGATAIGFTLWFGLIGRIGPVRSACATFVSPVFAMLLGYFVLGEPVTSRMLVGTIVILFGTALTIGLFKGSLGAIVRRCRGLWPAGRESQSEGEWVDWDSNPEPTD